MDVNQSWVTFACQYRDDGWKECDLLQQGKNQKIGQQPNNGISSDDQRAVILSWILLARICSLRTVPFYFFSIPQHNKVKQAGSGKQRFIDSSF